MIMSQSVQMDDFIRKLKQLDKWGQETLDLKNKVNELSEGAKNDTGKPAMGLVAPELLFAVSTILEFGARKYAARNWEKGISYTRVFGGLMRHLWAWWGGEESDPETGYSHLWHAGCGIMFLIAYNERGMKQFDDRR